MIDAFSALQLNKIFELFSKLHTEESEEGSLGAVLHLEIYPNATPKDGLHGSGAAARRRGISAILTGHLTTPK